VGSKLRNSRVSTKIEDRSDSAFATLKKKKRLTQHATRTLLRRIALKLTTEGGGIRLQKKKSEETPGYTVVRGILARKEKAM